MPFNFGKIIAHRGASAYAPENTLAAFRKAKELGAQWIECDARLTWDGEIVIFHDDYLNRTTNGFGWVRFKTYAALSKLDAGAGESIIRLETLLDVLDKMTLSINLEIKPSWGKVRQITEKVLAIWHQKPRKNVQMLMSSFNISTLKMIKECDRLMPIGWNIDRWPASWQKTADDLSCVSIHCSKKIVNLERVSAIKNTGRQVLSYTVNDRSQAEKLFKIGVDAVFSDYPDLLSQP